MTDPAFRTDINALRALAIGAVLLFHFGVPGITGGFVGVDVFYVISGFLMMQIISTKLAADRFSFTSFYLARARRIVPALTAVTLTTLLCGWVLLIPSEYKDLGQHATSALTFYSNFVFSRGKGYFTGNTSQPWLLHTWSLAVEWQFYLLFPVLLVVVRRIKQGRYTNHILGALFSLSLILSITLTPSEPKASFYLLHTRAYELIAGALVFACQQRLKPLPWQACFGLALITLTAVFLPKSATFPGAWPLLPVIGTALVLHARPSFWLTTNRLTQVLGTLSYSLYLWHWPILVIAIYLYGPLGLVSGLTCSVLTLLAATASYWLIETPARTLRFTRPVAFAAAAVWLLVLGASVCVWKTGGVPARTPPAIAAQLTEDQQLLNQWSYPRPCDNYKHDPAKKPVGYCTLGDAADTKVLVWGDSHIEHLYPALQALAAEATARHVQILLGTSAGCPPVRGLNRTETGYHCDAFTDILFSRALQPDVKIVVLGAYWQNYISAPGMLTYTSPTMAPIPTTPRTLAALQVGLERDLNQLHAAGKQTFLLQPVPSYPAPVSTALARQLWGHAYTSFNIAMQPQTEAVRTVLTSAAHHTNTPVLDITSTLCPTGLASCVYEESGHSLYKDASHLSRYGALKLVPLLRQILKE